MASIFSRIIAGEVPGRFVWIDETCVGIIDVGPLRPGHCLVIPRVEVDHWLDLDDEVAHHCYRVARTIGAAQMRVFAPARIGLIVAGYEVPHTHLHVVPTTGMADFDFTRADRNPNPADLDDAAARLRADLVAHGHPEAAAAAPA
jgi:diadenosine tetraphosphate (Ap4A) HIT family hydrolase